MDAGKLLISADASNERQRLLCAVGNRYTLRKKLRESGAKLFFLPPYSPDLNPIEQMFSKLKHLLRIAAERTVEATWRRIGALLDTFTPKQCQAYLVNAGYASNKVITL